MIELIGSYLFFDFFKVNKKILLVVDFKKLKILGFIISFLYKEISWYKVYEINYLICVFMNFVNFIIYNFLRD